jgi:hypothetical protein
VNGVILPRAVNPKTGEVMATRTKPLLELSLFLNRLDPAKPWEVTVRPWKKSRSDAQNHALFGVAYKVICAETGFTKDELHDSFCRRFFGSKDTDVMGQQLWRPRRTTTRDENGKRDVLPWDQFADFYATVQQVAAEAGILVPDPDPNWRQTS